METITKTTESGAFIRTTIRRGKQRTQTTKRIKPNMKKVILGSIGDFEVYVYPFDYPDKVFIGKFPVSTFLDKTGLAGVQGIINISRWFLDGKALNELSAKEKARITPNYNYTTVKEKN
jgi:hypothetical protein